MAPETVEHAYPRDLAALVRERWGDHPGLPKPSPLGRLLSTCYQAGLMREEERPVTFRLVLSEAGSFTPEVGPPAGLHRLEFVVPRLFDEDELRRLSPAADFYRSLIGARAKGDGGLEIWGLVHSGPRWVRSIPWPPRQLSSNANTTHRTTRTNTTVDIVLGGIFIVFSGLDQKF